jgi:hypothetical protein
MSIPGFEAENSIYRSSKNYKLASQNFASMGEVQPSIARVALDCCWCSQGGTLVGEIVCYCYEDCITPINPSGGYYPS